VTDERARNHGTTSVQRTEELLRYGASSLVLREAFFRVRRFDDFQRVLDISRSVLSRTLKHLVEAGILERRRYQQRPDRYEYLLTEAGLELYPVFLVMKQWGEKWLGDDARDISLHHVTCGHVSTPQLTCDHCGGPVHARDMRYVIDGDA